VVFPHNRNKEIDRMIKILDKQRLNRVSKYPRKLNRIPVNNDYKESFLIILLGFRKIFKYYFQLYGI
jgi:hypothetical protein